jgi:hypothetical protein
MHLPYYQARCAMFDQVVSSSKRVPTTQTMPIAQQAPTPPIDEEALAQRIVGLIIPSLDDIIKKTVESAFRMHSPIDASEPTTQPHIAVNPPYQSQPLKVNISNPEKGQVDDGDDIIVHPQHFSQSIRINISDTDEDDDEDDDDDIHLLHYSQPVRINPSQSTWS